MAKADGNVEVVDETNDLRELQRMVGGYVEMIRMGDNLVMLVNEDARLLENRPNVNVSASRYLGMEILGDVVLCLCEGGMFKGVPESEAIVFKNQKAEV